MSDPTPEYAYITGNKDKEFNPVVAFDELQRFVEDSETFSWSIEQPREGLPISRCGITSELSEKVHFITKKPDHLILYLFEDTNVLGLCEDFANSFDYRLGYGVYEDAIGYDESFFGLR